MGIKNHLFMLAIYDQDLIGIDPRTPNLPQDIAIKIGIECERNFWYAVRNIWLAPSKSGIGANMIECNRSNLATWWSFSNHVTFALTQCRQTGKTFTTNVTTDDTMNFRCHNTEINLLTKDDTLRASTVKDVKEIYEELPPYLNFRKRGDSNNTENFTVVAKNNIFRVHVPQASRKKAANAARGQVSPLFRIDEGPFQTNIEYAFPAAIAAMGAVREEARRKGEPYGILLSHTAGSRDEPSGEYIYEYCRAGADWTDKFYDAKNSTELEEMVKRHSRGGISRIYAVFSHKQLGKTDAWVQEQITEGNLKPDEADRDYFNRWTTGRASSPLPPDIIKKLNNSVTCELYTEICKHGFILKWYIPEKNVPWVIANEPMVIGVDTSDASGGDDISFVGRSVTSGKVLVTGKFNSLNLIIFADFLVDTIVRMPHSTMIIERKSSGSSILDYIIMMLVEKGIDPFTRLFNWVINDPAEHETIYEEFEKTMSRRDPKIYDKSKKYFGYATSGGGKTSRSDLYSNTLMSLCNVSAGDIYDKDIVEQIKGLVIRNNRIDHPPGGNDDMVIGTLLTQWLLTNGKNLIEYGISPNEVFSDSRRVVASSPSERFFQETQEKYKDRIKYLLSLMENEREQYILSRYELEIRQLDKKIITKNDEVYNIDTLLDKIKEKKKQQQLANRNNYYQRYPNRY